jgi:glycosyltransferase involved in cell wall biosynthesis
MESVQDLRVGLLTSVGQTLDAFFPRIVTRWQSRGIPVSAASSSETVSLPVPYTRIRHLSRSPRADNVLAPRELRDWVGRSGVSCIVTSTATASALVRVAELPIPVVYFCHGLHWSDTSRVTSLPWRAVERLLLRRASAVITINECDHRWFRRQLSSAALLRLPQGVGLDPASYPRSPVPSSRVLQLCWIGELISRKAPLDVVRVAEILTGSGVDVRIRVLGDGPLRPVVQRAVHDAGLSGHVQLLGHQPAASALSASHALLHTAHWEGLPRVALEAAAVGRAVYAYDAKGVRDAPTVRTVPERDPRVLARRIAQDWCAGRIAPGDQLPPIESLDSDVAADAIADLLVHLHSTR